MSCQNAHCEAERDGWVTVLDPENAKHASALRWLRGDQGRRFLQLRSEDAAEYISNHGASQGITDDAGKLARLIARTPPGLLLLVFYPGQPCLRPHIDREVIFTHSTRRGGVRVHERPLDFNESMNEQAYAVGVLEQRG